MVTSIKVIKMKRKTMQIKIEKDLNVTVKVPYGTSEKVINEFIQNHKTWIENNIKKQKELNDSLISYTDEEIKKMEDDAYKVIPPLVDYYSKLMGVTYSKLCLKHLKSKWGSCSSKGVIDINIRLMATNKEVLEYVIVHELAHLKYMNHSSSFYKFVEKYKPNYKECKAYLKTNGYVIMRAFERD